MRVDYTRAGGGWVIQDDMAPLWLLGMLVCWCLILVRHEMNQLCATLIGSSLMLLSCVASLPKTQLECEAVNGTWDITSMHSRGYCIGDNQKKCLDRGGIWRRVCLSQGLYCVMPFADGGKECTDGTQCEGGRCLDVGNKPRNDRKITGQCRHNNDPCGSFAFIENGQRGPLMSVD